MTNQNKPSPNPNLVGSKLPWLVGGAALIIYLLTLNHWVSLNNLMLVARNSGWVWGVNVYNPVFFLVTLPIQLLPPTCAPLAFNLFSALCGALTIALLARSVALLPHDRTHDQRLREKHQYSLLSIKSAWLPPVFAALVFGLRLTVWEHATTGANDMFDCLLLAYIVRCLLEYRLGEKDSWLFRAGFVMGAAMANAWLIFVLFPAFLIAVIWIKKLEFFKAQFLLKMLFCGAAGTLFYLLLPAVHVLSSQPLVSFWAALKMNLATDKQAFLFFFTRAPLSVTVLLLVISLLPLLIMGIRWASNFGDPSRVGSSITSLIFHVAHAALLLVLLWVAFDPVFSPRRKGFELSPLDWLSALSIGYLVGYFLLVFKPVPDRMNRTTQLQVILSRVSPGAIIFLLILVPASLFIRNLPQLRLTNGSALRDYAAQLTEKLPEHSVILSDDSRKLYLAQTWLAGQGKLANHIFLDTGMLTAPDYHAFQKKLHPDSWPDLPEGYRKEGLGANLLISLLLKLSETNTISYLHPSFGYYFEVFDQRPNGLNLILTRYPTNALSGPPLTKNEIAANENFWTAHQVSLNRLLPFIQSPVTTTNLTVRQVLNENLSIPFQPNATAVLLGRFYSQALNFWGVQLQRADQRDAAQRRFRLALEMFPENIAAKNNLAFNHQLKAGQTPEISPLRSLEEELGTYRTWDQALRDTGPFDDPTHCFTMGLIFAQGNNFRQAAQQLERAHALVPDHLPASFWLSRLYVMNQQPDKASTLLAELRRHPEELLANGIRKVDLLQAEAGALYVSGKTTEADELVRSAMRQNPTDPQTLSTAIQISAVFKSYTNALLAIDYLLKIKPDDTQALLSKGVLNIQSGTPQEAIAPLTRILSLQSTNYGARLYRAVAYLGSQQVEEAQKDYETLQKTFPNSNEVNSGLAEVALRRQDTNTALHYYELCLKNVPAASPQAKAIAEQINKLKNPQP